ncbi:hypothetical protein PICSAR164_00943 [Mycobacterium avium subsp. paratuberculosis]|nr:hypothetical protein PICSAR164_00943 [Mycobacterium avium subsp. paratuberculosis]CAG7330953.1 hypothetical protein PICSAR65_03302 [Mycobacterium avium subsp. paratuberculosis]
MSFFIRSRRCRNDVRIRDSRSQTTTLALLSGAQKNAASPSSLASFRPLPALITDSSSPATVSWACARCVRFHCM